MKVLGYEIIVRKFDPWGDRDARIRRELDPFTLPGDEKIVRWYGMPVSRRERFLRSALRL